MRRLILASPSVRRAVLRLAEPRAHDILRQLAPFLRSNEHILDVGSGIGDVTLAMQQAGNDVTALDVENLSCTPEVQPVLYDGHTMPFANKSFDTATIITTMHHATDPDRVLAESARVAKRLIIIEDIYHSTPHKYATYFMDSLLNLEFVGHPHSNKTDEQWKAAFTKLDLKLVAEQANKSFVVMRHKLYVLEH